jgi:putative exporter of polyketide antibiotics
MKFWIIACKVIGYMWFVLIAVVTLFGTLIVWLTQGPPGVQKVLSPFSIENWIALIVSLAPAIGLLVVAEILKSKQNKSA